MAVNLQEGPYCVPAPRNFCTPAPLWARTEIKGTPEMSNIFIIEVRSEAAGIVMRNPDGYRFFAASHRFNPLEGQLFRNPREAERAAIRLAKGDLILAA